jgi:NitT/TauT family transport system substrate-binding protein
MRSNRLLPIAAWILCLWFAFACLGHAASQSESLTIGYSSFSGHYVPFWIAIEDHLGKKYGLDLKAVYAGRARPQQLLISGEMPFVVATGTGALTSHVLGVKDQVIVLTFANMVPGVIVAKPEIKTGEDLRGKVIGTGRPGALADTMVRYVLQSKMNLMPDRDVKLLPLGEPAIALQALERGVVDAASFSGPPVLMAKKKGFRELINYEKLGMVYPYNTVTTLRQTVSKRPELLEKVLKTMIEGISIFKTNKEKSISVWRKYLRGASDDILEEAYQSTLGELERVPIPSLQVIQSGLDILALQYPQAKQTDPNLIIDPTFVRRIEQSGFIDALYKK